MARRAARWNFRLPSSTLSAAALRSALSDRARNDRIHAVTEIIIGQTPSTKSAKTFLGTLTDRNRVLIVIGRADEAGAKSVRNLPGVHVISPDQLNTYDVLVSDDVIFTTEALETFLAGPAAGKSAKAVATESEAREEAAE